MMRFQAEHSPILDALQFAARATSRDAEILQCVRLSADGGRVTIMGTDTHMECHATCEASVSVHGSVVVHAGALLAALKSCRDVVSFESLDGKFFLKAGSGDFSIQESVRDLPRLPKPDAADEVEGGIVALRVCSKFSSTDEHQGARTGVFFDRDRALAMDGPLALVATVNCRGSRVVPARAAKHIPSDDARLFVGDTSWRIEAEGRVVCGLTMESNFPDFRSAKMPETLAARVDADELTASINAATLGGLAREFCLVSDGQSCSITGEKFGVHSASGNSRCQLDGAPFTTVCNAKQVQKVLATMSGLTIDLIWDGGPLMIRPVGRREFGFVGVIRDARNSINVSEVAA